MFKRVKIYIESVPSQRFESNICMEISQLLSKHFDFFHESLIFILISLCYM